MTGNVIRFPTVTEDLRDPVEMEDWANLSESLAGRVRRVMGDFTFLDPEDVARWLDEMERDAALIRMRKKPVDLETFCHRVGMFRKILEDDEFWSLSLLFFREADGQKYFRKALGESRCRTLFEPRLDDLSLWVNEQPDMYVIKARVLETESCLQVSLSEGQFKAFDMLAYRELQYERRPYISRCQVEYLKQGKGLTLFFHPPDHEGFDKSQLAVMTFLHKVVTQARDHVR